MERWLEHTDNGTTPDEQARGRGWPARRHGPGPPLTPPVAGSEADGPPAATGLEETHAEPGAPLGAFVRCLGLWRAALRKWAATLGAFAREVGESGARAAGSRWPAAGGQLAEAVKGLGSADIAVPEGAAAVAPDRVTALMDASDAAEAAARALEGVAVVYLDPNVRLAATMGLSRTYSENVGSLARAARDAAAAAAELRREAATRAYAAGATFVGLLPADAVAGAYGAPTPRGGVATELYLGLLVCLRTGAAAVLLDAAKDTTLGCSPDAPAAAAAATRALAGYHPLQAMAYAPAVPEAPAPDTPAERAVDLTLPQARLAVVYDLGLLIDGRRARELGALVPATAGLSHRLVERLRSIRAVPLRPGAAGPVGHEGARTAREPEAALVRGAITVTTDGGNTVHALGPAGHVPPGGPWAPFAGARPRAEQYAAATAQLILRGLQADRDRGWTPDLRERYGAAVEGRGEREDACPPEATVGALVAEFRRALEAGPPADDAALRELVLPEAAPGDYVAAAVSRVADGLLEGRLRQCLGVPAPPAPYAAVEREARLSQLVHVTDAAQALRLRLRLAHRPQPEAFALPPAQRQEALLAAFRRAAEAALAGPPLACAPLTLKLYACLAARPGGPA
jgi:hypothetical protein